MLGARVPLELENRSGLRGIHPAGRQRRLEQRMPPQVSQASSPRVQIIELQPGPAPPVAAGAEVRGPALNILTGAEELYNGTIPAFTQELRDAAWPPRFSPEMPPRFDGTTNPSEFLTLYTLAITAARGDSKVAANWFIMGLKDAARLWLLNLPAGSISSWSE